MKTINFLKTALLTIALFVCGNVGAETITISKAAIPDLTEEASEHTFSINDIEFIGKLKYSVDNLFFDKDFRSYIYNTTSLGTINSITINYGINGSPGAHQYFSSGDAAISGYQSGDAQLTSSTPGESGIYSTFNGGFFNLSISNKNLQASSIVIDYTPTKTTPTEAYTVTFNAGTGTCETTSLTEATPGAGITLPTATSPCPENWTFVGWVKEEVTNITNTQPITYAAELTYYPTANETLYAVYTKTDESTSEATLTLNATNIGSMGGGTGYQDDDFTFSGITFGRKQAYINSQSIQIKKGTNYSVWNKTPLSGNIVSVTVTPKTNDCMLYVGSSAEPSTNSQIVSSTQTYEFEGTDGYRYFRIGATSGAYTQIQEVKIVYNESSATYSTNPECSAITVAAPTFNVEAGTYYEPQTVKITAEEGATIYYTINGDEPTTSSTEYNNDNPITISTTTTLKAIAVKENTNSVVTEATYILPTEAANIAAYNALGKNTLTKIAGTITVSYINGSNIYAQDETGAMLIYDYDYAQTEGLAAGATISNLIGTKSEHGGAAQMANVISSTIGEGTTTLVPTTVLSVTEADLHKYVRLEDAQFDQSYSFTDNEPINATLSTHGEIVVRNNFKNFTMDVTATDKYDIIGFVSVYYEQVQLYPISIKVTTPSITLSTNSLVFETVENNQTKDLTFTVNGANLSENATLAISGDNAGYFTCDPTSITPAEDGSIAETNITVTYQPTATGEHAATLTITCGDLTKEIALSGTCINPILATPVAIEATAITANGFTANWEAVENATSYDVNVWTNQEIFNEDFSEIEAGNNTSTNGSSSEWKGNANFSNINKVYQAGEAIKLGGGSATGSITTKELELTGSDVEVLFDVKGWTNVEGDIKITIGEASQTISYEATINDAFESKSVLFQNVTANTITIATTAKRAFIDNIVIIKKENIAGSPFSVTGLTNTAIINLSAETTYYYNVVAKADGYTASEASNTVEVKTLGEPTYAITGEGVTFDEATGYTLELGEVVLNDVAKEFTLTASNYNSSISLSSTRGLWKLAETAATGDLYTFAPDENGSINANLTVSFKTTEEMMGTTIEDLINIGRIAYGRPQTEQWAIIIDGEIDNYLYISFTPTEEGPVTGICDQPEMEGISFNGQEIINSLNLDVEVYNAIGQMVVRSNENINMSSYPAGVYVIKAANGESMKIVK